MDDLQFGIALYRALDIYRSTIRQFIARTLPTDDPNWAVEYVWPAVRHTRAGRQLEKRITTDSRQNLKVDMLGINLSRLVIKHNWELFNDQFEGEQVLDAMAEVRHWRNMWAHEQIEAKDLDWALEILHHILLQIDPDAAQRITALGQPSDHTDV